MKGKLKIIVAVLITTFIFSIQTQISSAQTVSNVSVDVGDVIKANNKPVSQHIIFGYRIKAGKDTLYISKDPSLATSISSSGFPDETYTTMTSMWAFPATLDEDTSEYYVIPAKTTRIFSLYGTIKLKNTNIGVKTLGIEEIKYGIDPEDITARSIISGLGDLRASFTSGDGTSKNKTIVSKNDCYVFTDSLSLGSQGPDVVALQNLLINKGYLKLPTGAKLGYLDSLTKTAISSLQSAIRLPNNGNVGALSIVKLNDCKNIPSVVPIVKTPPVVRKITTKVPDLYNTLSDDTESDYFTSVPTISKIDSITPAGSVLNTASITINGSGFSKGEMIYVSGNGLVSAFGVETDYIGPTKIYIDSLSEFRPGTYNIQAVNGNKKSNFKAITIYSHESTLLDTEEVESRIQNEQFLQRNMRLQQQPPPIIIPPPPVIVPPPVIIVPPPKVINTNTPPPTTPSPTQTIQTNTSNPPAQETTVQQTTTTQQNTQQQTTVTQDQASTPVTPVINPSSGPTGKLITITGSGFSATLAKNLLKINGSIISISTATPTTMTFTVPRSLATYVGKALPLVYTNTETNYTFSASFTVTDGAVSTGTVAVSPTRNVANILTTIGDFLDSIFFR